MSASQYSTINGNPTQIHVLPYDENVLTQHNPAISKSRYITGIIMLFCVVGLWVGSGTLIQHIFTQQHYNQPFLLTYFSTSLFILYIPCYYITQYIKNKYNNHNNTEKQQLLHISAFHDTIDTHTHITPNTIQLPIKQSLVLCPLWFGLNYTYNLSLSMTSISSATILSSSSSLFVLIYSVCLLNTKFTAPNILGVLLTICGAAMISYKDDDSSMNGNQSVHGDILAGLSASIYGLYTVMLKYIVPVEREKSYPMLLIFGCIGLINLLTLWPLFFVFNMTGIEQFVLPSITIFSALLLNGIFGTVISDYLWARSVLLTSPLIASLGLSLTIPLAMFVDVLFNSYQLSVIYLIGSILVISGFILVNAFHESTELVNVDQQSESIRDIEIK